MKNFISRFTVILATVMSLLGCATSSGLSVMRPDVSNSRKIAIISIHSNSALYNLDEGESLTDLAGYLRRQADEDPSWGEQKTLQIAKDSFLRELGKIEGWKILPVQQVIHSDKYIDFAHEYNRNGRQYGLSRRVAYSAYPGMANVLITPDLNKNLIPKLAQLAADLNVDAVAIVQLDIAYHSFVSSADTSTVKPSVAASLCLVDTRGKILINTPWEIRQGQGVRQTSKKAGVLSSGVMIYNSVTEKLFEEAIQKNAEYFRGQITGEKNS